MFFVTVHSSSLVSFPIHSMFPYPLKLDPAEIHPFKKLDMAVTLMKKYLKYLLCLECVMTINKLTSNAISVPPFSTGNCCLLISPATPLTETVEGTRSYVTWKFSVVYYPHVNSRPILTYKIAFFTVLLCCVYNVQVSSIVSLL